MLRRMTWILDIAAKKNTIKLVVPREQCCCREEKAVSVVSDQLFSQMFCKKYNMTHGSCSGKRLTPAFFRVQTFVPVCCPTKIGILFYHLECKEGFHYNPDTPFFCHACPIDTYQPKPNMEFCQPCPKGTITLSKGSNSCVPLLGKLRLDSIFLIYSCTLCSVMQRCVVRLRPLPNYYKWKKVPPSPRIKINYVQIHQLLFQNAEFFQLRDLRFKSWIHILSFKIWRYTSAAGCINS